MPNHDDWRDVQAARARIDPIQAALDVWHRLRGTEEWHEPEGSERDWMAAAIAAHDDALAELLRCDEPRCRRDATCGWPTQGGYRQTCGEHAGSSE